LGGGGHERREHDGGQQGGDSQGQEGPRRLSARRTGDVNAGTTSALGVLVYCASAPVRSDSRDGLTYERLPDFSD
jgi:hypothetical protein